uniref:Thioredoxin domain-containing protein n=1 Tax=viral metagenome TaxID=1070528 RepID=A0A6C0EQF4_9ZZZZ
MVNYVNFNGSGIRSPLGSSDTSIYSRIKTAGSNLSNTTLLIIISVLVFSFIAGFYIFYYYLPSLKSSYKPNSEQIPIGSVPTGNVAELLFFYADWCPHCKTAKPVWEELKSEYENKTVNGYKVVFTEINCTTETAEVEQMMNKYHIEGFPTIKLLKDGQVVEYDAKPTKATLEQFLNTVL